MYGMYAYKYAYIDPFSTIPMYVSMPVPLSVLGIIHIWVLFQDTVLRSSAHRGLAWVHLASKSRPHQSGQVKELRLLFQLAEDEGLLAAFVASTDGALKKAGKDISRLGRRLEKRPFAEGKGEQMLGIILQGFIDGVSLALTYRLLAHQETGNLGDQCHGWGLHNSSGHVADAQVA